MNQAWRSGDSRPCNGDRIRFLRRQRSWTQADLARAAGYSERLVSKAEAGKSLSIATIVDLAEALTTDRMLVSTRDLTFCAEDLAKQYLNALYVHQRDAIDKIAHFLHPNVVFRLDGEKRGLPFAGIHKGIDAIQKAFHLFFDLLEVPKDHDFWPDYRFIGEGEEVVIWGHSWIHPIGKPLDEPIQLTMRLRFEEGKLIELDDRFDSEFGARILGIEEDPEKE